MKIRDVLIHERIAEEISIIDLLEEIDMEVVDTTDIENFYCDCDFGFEIVVELDENNDDIVVYPEGAEDGAFNSALDELESLYYNSIDEVDETFYFLNVDNEMTECRICTTLEDALCYAERYIVKRVTDPYDEWTRYPKHHVIIERLNAQNKIDDNFTGKLKENIFFWAKSYIDRNLELYELEDKSFLVIPEKEFVFDKLENSITYVVDNYIDDSNIDYQEDFEIVLLLAKYTNSWTTLEKIIVNCDDDYILENAQSNIVVKYHPQLIKLLKEKKDFIGYDDTLDLFLEEGENQDA